MEIRTIPSLAKVFADEAPPVFKYNQATALSNETFSFQVAYRHMLRMTKHVQVRVDSPIAHVVSVRTVELVPVQMPHYADHDKHVLRTAPGLYPDLLRPLDEEGLTCLPAQWRSLWVTVTLADRVPPGDYPIRIILEQSQHVLAKTEFTLTVLEARLAEQTLIHTEWFHSDCIATRHDVPVFSDAHWALIDTYMKTASEHGINMILTPIFTPPLDTQIGGERPTVQLVDVTIQDGQYRFGFEKLQKWMDLCDKNGFRYYEMAHLFTQWGAEHAPKIMAVEQGVQKRIFGWETDVGGEGYKTFLDAFLPALVQWLRQRGVQDRTYFHISDEPSMTHIESYKRAKSLVEHHLVDFPIIDALSDYAFYEQGLVKNPIPANNHIEPFLENQVPDLWTYTCCGQYKEVSNRFIAMPSARNRIIGWQFYQHNIVGFLQWGYNFWYSQYSRKPIDPFLTTDAGFFVPAGDAYVVYPNAKAPLESIRLEVFFEAIQDMRALATLENKIGRQKTLQWLESTWDEPMTFSCYPRKDDWILQNREKCNRKIMKACGM